MHHHLGRIHSSNESHRQTLREYLYTHARTEPDLEYVFAARKSKLLDGGSFHVGIECRHEPSAQPSHVAPRMSELLGDTVEPSTVVHGSPPGEVQAPSRGAGSRRGRTGGCARSRPAARRRSLVCARSPATMLSVTLSAWS